MTNLTDETSNLHRSYVTSLLWRASQAQEWLREERRRVWRLCFCFEGVKSQRSILLYSIWSSAGLTAPDFFPDLKHFLLFRVQSSESCFFCSHCPSLSQLRRGSIFALPFQGPWHTAPRDRGLQATAMATAAVEQKLQEAQKEMAVALEDHGLLYFIHILILCIHMYTYICTYLHIFTYTHRFYHDLVMNLSWLISFKLGVAGFCTTDILDVTLGPLQKQSATAH